MAELKERTLSTSEVAALMGCSRQHVADLCDRGVLPYTTPGVHRRMRWEDVDRIVGGTKPMTRDQRRSHWLSLAVVGALVQDPERVLILAKTNVQRMQAVHPRGQARHWLDEWAKVLDGPLSGVVEALTSPSARSRELRQNSPFAGVLSDEDRAGALKTFQIAETSLTGTPGRP